MKSIRLALCACMLACLSLASATAKDVTVTYSEDEQRALLQLLDAAVKCNGLAAAQNAAVLAQKLVSTTPSDAKGAEPAKPDK